MDLKHFGDSYDVVKKSLLMWLSDLGPWCVHPMFTHETTTAEAQAFGRFLGVPLVSTAVLNQETDRREYFLSCRDSHALFLDPDTGVRLSRCGGGRSPKYLFAEELIEMASARPSALTSTFDQSLPRGREREEAQAKLAHFREHGMEGFVYVSHASFMVLGKSRELVQQGYERLLANSVLPENRFITSTGVVRQELV